MDLIYKQNIDADAETMYAAVSSAKGIQGWWCQNSDIADTVGGIHTLSFVKEGNPVVMKFKLDELSDNKRVVWTCTENVNPTWIGTKLIFEMNEKGVLNFTHANFDDKWKGEAPVKMTAEGWNHFMLSLKNYCETGEGQPW